MTTEVRDVTALPWVPAVYVMYGGSPRWAAYVGIGSDLRERIAQHLIKRDSSIATFTSAVGLEHPHLADSAAARELAKLAKDCCRTLELDRPRDTR